MATDATRDAIEKAINGEAEKMRASTSDAIFDAVYWATRDGTDATYMATLKATRDATHQATSMAAAIYRQQNNLLLSVAAEL